MQARAKLRLVILSGTVFTLIPLFLLLFYFLQTAPPPGCGNKDALLFCGTKNTPPNALLGKEIFNSNCAACHRVYDTENMLRGCFGRMPDSTYFYHFVTRQDSLLKIKDPYALAVKSTWDTIYIHQFSVRQNEMASLKRYLKFTEN